MYTAFRMCWVLLLALVTTAAAFVGLLALVVAGVTVSAERRAARRGALAGRLLRRFFLTAGGAFIKMGQILSARRDLLPDSAIEQLATLQDRVPPVSFRAIETVIVSDLGRSLAECFASFEETSIAAGSIAQVHEARLLTGERVAVKVKRPGIERAVHADTRLLCWAARFLGAIPLLRPLALPALADEIAQAIVGQLDFRAEMTHNRRFSEMYADVDFVHVPWTYAEACGDAVITLEFVEGKKITALGDLNEASATRLAENLVDMYQMMVFETLLVHADLHPGNLLITPELGIILLDTGLVFEIPVDYRERFRKVLVALLTFDGEVLADAYLEGRDVPDATRDVARREVGAMCARYKGLRATELEVSQMLLDILRLLRRHGIVVDREWSGLILGELTFEGIVKEMDGHVDAIALATRKLQERLARLSTVAA